MQVPPPPAGDGSGDLLGTLRKIAHALVLVGIFIMAATIALDLVFLAWSHWPVSRAAGVPGNYSVAFVIAPGPVGEATWTGWGALALGAVLLFVAVALHRVQRGGRVPGMAGTGTRIAATLSGLFGLGALALSGYLAATGQFSEGLAVPNVLPVPVGLMLLEFTQLTHWHSIMVGAILMSAVMMAVVDGPPLIAMLRRGWREGVLPPVRTDNTVITVFRMFLALVAFIVIYNVILGLFTVSPEVPAFGEEPLWRQLHSFAVASVWEEVLTRVLLLGVPLLVYHAVSGRLRSPAHRYLLGGGFTIDTAAFVLVVLQATVFGLAHVAGWDLWKVLPTVLTGIAMGYLFLRRGLWAAVLLHFTFDYWGMTTEVLGAWGLDVSVAFNIGVLFMVGVGSILVVHYTVIIVTEGPAAVRGALWGVARDRGERGGKV